ncbi:MAG: flagellin FliC [Planctomycetes bacterium]|nr:flagellin FliC [Planctomycetota bacterium]MCC7169599.1 flagellin FliC [Planctomycetota bacterium]
MALRINNNVASLTAQKNLAQVSGRLQGNFKRLASGLRIATAADDAAGLAISERLRSQIRSLSQAERNGNDAISLTQTAEGGLNEVSNILIRMRELAVQANTGTVSDSDKDTLQNELSELVDEIDRIAQQAEFNDIALLDGSSTTVEFAVGIGDEAGVDTISVTLDSVRTSDLSIDSIDIGSTGDVSVALSSIDDAIDTISEFRGRLGSTENRLNSAIANLQQRVESLTAAESRIRDVDVAKESADLTRNNILQQASLAILAQANLQPQSALQLLQG